MGIESPWHVTGVRLEAPTATVKVVAEFRGDKKCAAFDSCRMRRDAYQDEECLATEAQQDEAVEEITVEVVDPFIAAYRACVGRTAQWASKVQSLLPPFAITLHVPMSIFPNFIPLILLFTGTIKTSFNLCSPELGCLGSSDNFIISLDGWKNI